MEVISLYEMEVSPIDILSLMKTDRSFGIPFVKGYIVLELDKNEVQNLTSTNNQKNNEIDLNKEFGKRNRSIGNEIRNKNNITQEGESSIKNKKVKNLFFKKLY